MIKFNALRRSANAEGAALQLTTAFRYLAAVMVPVAANVPSVRIIVMKNDYQECGWGRLFETGLPFR